MDDFDTVKFVANEDQSSELGGIDSDVISLFYKEFCENFDEGEKLCANELSFQDIDQKYLSIFFSYFHRKSSFSKSTVDHSFLAKFSKATAEKL